MYKCIIVDDQREAVEILANHVSNTSFLSLSFSSTNPFDALSFLDKNSVDLLFLDIQMPGISGLEIIESLREKWGYYIPKIVLTTGYDEYALASYEYGVFDYLLKPVSYLRFKKCVDRIKLDIEKRVHPENAMSFFFADIDGQKVKIDFEDIHYIEGARNYIFIGTGNKKVIIYNSMTNMEEILPTESFMRVHKSYIVCINKIKAIKGNEIIVNINGQQKNIPLGITFKENVLTRLKISERKSK